MNVLILAAGQANRLHNKLCIKLRTGETTVERHQRIFRKYGVEPIVIRESPNEPHTNVLKELMVSTQYWTGDCLFVLGDTVLARPMYPWLFEGSPGIRFYGSNLLKSNWVERSERWAVRVDREWFGVFSHLLVESLALHEYNLHNLVDEWSLPTYELSAAGDLDLPEDLEKINSHLENEVVSHVQVDNCFEANLKEVKKNYIKEF